MDSIIKRWIFSHWQRKIVSLLAAVVIWFFVNQSITESKILIGVPIRIINLQPNKTIDGLQPNGILNRRVTLTLTGQKKVIDSIEPGDIEVTLDASNAPKDWLVQIGKRDITSLTPQLDTSSGITGVNHPEFLIHLSRLVTEKVPVRLETIGKLPRNYDFLGIWPQTLTQIVSGPEEEVDKLKSEGLELTIDLDLFTKEELSALTTPEGDYFSDEVSFKIPDNWKKVYIPFIYGAPQPLNDSEAENLRLDFLRKDFIPLKQLLPIRVFYPMEHIDLINPITYSLAKSDHIQELYGLTQLKTPLLAYEVSELFINIVRDNMAISIIAAPTKPGEELQWSVEFIEPQALEDRYVAFQHQRHPLGEYERRTEVKLRENMWRQKFRAYMQNITLWKSKNTRLDLDSTIEGNHIYVDEKD